MTAIGALVVAVLFAAAPPASGQTRTITGRVTDDSGSPVTGATVEVINQSGAVVGFVQEQRRDGGQTWRAITDKNGNYGVAVSTSGMYLVMASKDGVGTDRTEVAVGFDSVSSVNLRLAKAAVAATDGAECAEAKSTTASSEVARSSAATHPAIDRLLKWLDAVQVHRAACSDAAVRDVGRWSADELETLLGDLSNIAAFREWIRDKPLERDSSARSTLESLTGTERRTSEARFVRDRDRVGAIIIRNRRFDYEELEKIFQGNETLKRGAVLHADIAVFVPGNFKQYPTVSDGRRESARRGTLHWQTGRLLLDMVSPAPTRDAGSHLWYRAIAAHLFHQGNLAEVAQHLRKAREVFPGDRQLLLDSAYLHLELSSPAVQAAVQQLRAEGADTAVEARRTELQTAERFLRATLAVANDDPEARYRLGHTLGELGRHAEAAAELRAAIDANPSREQRYLAELFLAREEHALGNAVEAKRHYSVAASLFPGAQSPQMGIAHLARSSGNLSAALDAVRTATDVAGGGNREDPWHAYYKAHLADAETLMREMREQLGGAR